MIFFLTFVIFLLISFSLFLLILQQPSSCRARSAKGLKVGQQIPRDSRPFFRPLFGKVRERPFPPVSTNQLSSRNRQTNRYTHRKRGEKGFLLYEVWISCRRDNDYKTVDLGGKTHPCPLAYLCAFMFI